MQTQASTLLRDTTETVYYSLFESGSGAFLAATTSTGLCLLLKDMISGNDLESELRYRVPKAQLVRNDEHDVLKETAHAVRAFDANEPYDVSHVSLDLRGTPFQRKAWNIIAQIPHGETITYKELAEKVGSPNASRAAGSACGKNPIPYLIPCHRVVGHGNSLGGFTWSLDVKRRLLKRENPTAWPEEWGTIRLAA